MILLRTSHCSQVFLISVNLPQPLFVFQSLDLSEMCRRFIFLSVPRFDLCVVSSWLDSGYAFFLLDGLFCRSISEAMLCLSQGFDFPFPLSRWSTLWWRTLPLCQSPCSSCLSPCIPNPKLQCACSTNGKAPISEVSDGWFGMCCEGSQIL